MSPSAVYRKSDKGTAELSGGQRTLAPRLRQALIMVNGKLTGAQLVEMLGGPVTGLALINELETNGYIESAGGGSAGAGASSSMATVDTRPTPLDAGPIDPKKLLAAQRMATRLLTDALGPAADDLASRIERAKTREEVEKLFTLAANTVREVAGRNRSEAFRAQVFGQLE